MALFGARKKLFPDPAYPRLAQPEMQPGLGTPQQPLTQAMPQERFKPNILGVIGDAMQVFAGGQATYMQGMQAEQARAQQARDKASVMIEQQKYEQGEWNRRQEYERANPKPSAPHYWETNDGSLGTIGADGKPTIVYKDPTPRMQWVPDGYGGGQMVPVTGTQAPQAPVGALKPVGKLTPYQGGQTARPSGGFR